MKMRRSLAHPGGFTLLEIMLVVMIIALLAAAAIYNMGDVFGMAGETKSKADINSLKTSLTMYRGLAGDYPTTEQGLKALVTRPESEPRPRSWRQFASELPVDGWQRDYFYEYPGRRNPNGYDLYSAGPDKKPGTDDDIGNWRQGS
jgi:general secretion pathway protein G